MRACFLTKEYPPSVYGGAGVHVDYLSRSLAKLIDVDVHCFGSQESREKALRVTGHPTWKHIAYGDKRFTNVIEAFATDLHMVADLGDIDIVHCHTWYSHLGGVLAKRLYGVPMILSTHSFEPSRPWKIEQLGNAYHLSSWVERLAINDADGVIAVSKGMKRDAVEMFGIPEEKVAVIHNGIDLDEYRSTDDVDALNRYGVDPRKPIVLFVGRITKQKGIVYLARAIPRIDKNAQIVLCAGAPDEPQILADMKTAVEEAKRFHPNVFWIEEMLPKKDVIQFYSHATVFCCPSIYEPFGIINLEAMACKTAVVASAIGGIPEVVIPRETGILVPLSVTGDGSSPMDGQAYSEDLASAINSLLAAPDMCAAFGRAGRRRTEEHFSWDAVAKRTVEYYEQVIERRSC